MCLSIALIIYRCRGGWPQEVTDFYNDTGISSGCDVFSGKEPGGYPEHKVSIKNQTCTETCDDGSVLDRHFGLKKYSFIF